MISPKRSFKGFKLSKNLVNAIKNAAFVLIPAILAELVTHNLITAGASGLIGTILLKGIEFWWKEYK
jgi:hypothetical protein